MSIYKQIPNWLTLGNLLLGCIAIVYLYYDHIIIRLVTQSGYVESGYFDGQAQVEGLRYGKMYIAGILILLAAVVDFLDGFAARLFNAQTAMGKQLDSLADVVTFGVAPGLLLYYLTAVSFFGSTLAFELGIILFVPAFFYTLMAAWRLARYNTDAPSTHFEGLPTPAAAIFVAGLPIALFRGESFLSAALQSPWLLYGIILMLGWLMASKLPMIQLKKSSDGSGGNARWWLTGSTLLIMAAGYFVMGWIGGLLPLAVLWYIIFSVVHQLIYRS